MCSTDIIQRMHLWWKSNMPTLQQWTTSLPGKLLCLLLALCHLNLCSRRNIGVIHMLARVLATCSRPATSKKYRRPSSSSSPTSRAPFTVATLVRLLVLFEYIHCIEQACIGLGCTPSKSEGVCKQPNSFRLEVVNIHSLIISIYNLCDK